MQPTVDAGGLVGRGASILEGGKPVGDIRVVAVDGDDGFREMLSSELSERGFAVTAFADPQSVLAAADTLSAADLIVLDWGEAGSSGLDLFRQLRRQGIALPVVFLTRRSLTSYERLAFEHGAIDFIDKSRGFTILVHRLRIGARFKVPETCREEVLQRGRLLLKPRISRAFWNDIDLYFTAGEFRTVHLLASNAGRHVTYREIYDVMRHRGFVAGSGDKGYRTNVRSAIKRIRRKFEELDPAFDRIQNYTAFGYIWAQD